MDEATFSKTGDGYTAKVEVIANKNKVDGEGNVSDVSISDWIDIGFYSDRAAENLMFNERVYIDKSPAIFEFQLDSIPAKAAIDPYRLLIDRVSKDNTKTVSEE